MNRGSLCSQGSESYVGDSAVHFNVPWGCRVRFPGTDLKGRGEIDVQEVYWDQRLQGARAAGSG